MASKVAEKSAEALGLNLRTVVRTATYSLLMSTVDSGSAAAFLPEVAAKFLPEERIAQVRAKGMEAMDRDLSLVWNPRVADSRASVRRALIRLRRVFGQRPFGSITTIDLELSHEPASPSNHARRSGENLLNPIANQRSGGVIRSGRIARKARLRSSHRPRSPRPRRHAWQVPELNRRLRSQPPHAASFSFATTSQ